MNRDSDVLRVEQVRRLLQAFQDGYAARDPAQLDAFMELFVDDGQLEVIGTNAVEQGEAEWCRGVAATRELIANDWQYWGDVALDVEGAHISVLGDVAWLATTGTVTDVITAQERYEGYLGFVEGILQNAALSQRDRVLEIVRLGNDILAGLPLPETFNWPFRFTAVAVRQDSQWRFHQMQFSFATTQAPDVRTS